MFYKSTQTHLQSLYGGILIPQTLKYEISPIQAEYSVICTNFNEELRHTGTKDKSLTKQNLKTSTPGTCLRTPWGTCTVSLVGNYLVRLLSFILAMQNCWIVFLFLFFSSGLYGFSSFGRYRSYMKSIELVSDCF